MLQINTLVLPSAIHGFGLFAAEPIRAGTLLWLFETPDCRIPCAEAIEADMHFGYINPCNPRWLVVCADNARFWNFAKEPNCSMAYPHSLEKESPLIATRDIDELEELTVGYETDFDAIRKIKGVTYHAC